ncbi:MAG: class I SAM-dependent methyltransferase [Tagaea sp.]
MIDPHHRLQTVSPWVLAHAGLVPPEAPVLDVAAGGGRHARFFAARGHKVTAVDKDIAHLGGHTGIEAVRADLEDGSPWPLAGRVFGAVVVTNYLHRPLFATLLDALAPGGVLIYETFARGNEAYGKPDNPDFLLEPNELIARVLSTCMVVAFEDTVVAVPKQAVVQRIAAIKA